MARPSALQMMYKASGPLARLEAMPRDRRCSSRREGHHGVQPEQHAQMSAGAGGYQHRAATPPAPAARRCREEPAGFRDLAAGRPTRRHPVFSPCSGCVLGQFGAKYHRCRVQTSEHARHAGHPIERAGPLIERAGPPIHHAAAPTEPASRTNEPARNPIGIELSMMGGNGGAGLPWKQGLLALCIASCCCIRWVVTPHRDFANAIPPTHAQRLARELSRACAHPGHRPSSCASWPRSVRPRPRRQTPQARSAREDRRREAMS